MKRHVKLMFVLCMLAFASVVRADGLLVVERKEVGPDEPMLVRIGVRADTSPRASLRLGWMDAGGDRLHTALVRVQPGLIDLAERFVDIRSHREVSYVQLFVDGRPRGSAVIVQPMLEPIVPMTVDGYRPDGSVYPRIVGWRTQRELAEMAMGEEEQEEEDEEAREDAEPEDVDEEVFDPERPRMIDRGRPADEALADPSRRLLGYRLYVERDVVLDTSFGKIRIVLRPDHAPETAWNFRELVRRGFYDGLAFHRIVPMTAAGLPFIIQAGDPTGEGHGGPGYELHLEPSAIAHDFGVISMARGDEPDSAGSQFFIALSREGTASLDGQYCAFGYAVSGREAILEIADGPLTDVRRGRPRWPVVIHEAHLVDAPPRGTGRGRADERVQRELPADERPATPRRVPR